MQAYMELENAHTSGVYGKRPVAIVRGSGALVWDAEGHEYIDCGGGHGVANLGHGRSEIAEALYQQAQQLITCPESMYNDVRARLLSRLAEVIPAGLDRFFLCNSGTEAVEAAIKFARLATGRSGIVSTIRGFHGRTMGALSATWERSYRAPFEPLVPGVRHVRYNDLSAMEGVVDESVAAVIIELVQGEGGVHVASEEYVRGIADLCRERGALLIVDEVQTGFGRTGTFFACERYQVTPDILCMAKAMAGGVPMGAVALGPRVTGSGRITRGSHGSTFGGNPLACAAALATLDVIEREHLSCRAANLGERALQRLRAIHAPQVRQVRGLGLLIGIELSERVQPYLEALLERGVIALPAGPNVIRLLPPLVITEEQLDRALDVIEEVLTRRESGQPGGLASRSEYPEVDLLSGMLTIPSYSGKEGALARYMVQQAESMGLQACIDEAGNFIARVPGREVGEQAPIVLLGHMDTVPGVIPVRVEGGALFGRGAVDAKGPLAAFLCAAIRIARSGRAHRPIVVIGAVEEEAATSRGARFVVDQYCPSACVIGEPSGSRAITIGYKGRLLVDYSITGPSSHSAGPHATASERAAAFWEKVLSHASGWNAGHAGTSAFAALSPTLRVINSSSDGLSDSASLTIGYRLPVGFDTAALRELLQAWAEEDGAAISFTGEEAALQSDRSSPLARAFVRAIRATGSQPTFKLKTGTSDMNVVGPAWGDNIVAYGPGDSSLDHTPNEHIQIAEYLHAIDVLESVISDW